MTPWPNLYKKWKLYLSPLLSEDRVSQRAACSSSSCSHCPCMSSPSPKQTVESDTRTRQYTFTLIYIYNSRQDAVICSYQRGYSDSQLHAGHSSLQLQGRTEWYTDTHECINSCRTEWPTASYSFKQDTVIQSSQAVHSDLQQDTEGEGYLQILLHQAGITVNTQCIKWHWRFL